MSWIKELQAASGSGVLTPALGWIGSGDKPRGFAYDSVVYTPSGTERGARSDTQMLNAWIPAGDLSKWKLAADFITNQKRPALDLILAASFAAPLVRFTGHKGLLGSAYSPETGIGKTTAMMVAASVWGHPTDSAQALDDTPLSSLKRLGAIQNLPFFWDEVRMSSQDKTDKLATLIFALTTGRERTRMNANATIQVAGKWQTMMVTASNQSLSEIAREATKGTDAGSVRVFEWRVPPMLGASTVTSSEAARVSGTTVNNYGRAGAVYAEWLGKNSVVAEQLVSRLSDALNVETQADPDERFWISSIATILAGASVARSLGLVNFDLAALKKFSLEALAALRMDRIITPSIGADTMPKLTELIGQYLSENKFEHTLETSIVPVKGGTNQTRIDAGGERLRSLDIQIDNTHGLVHLRTAPFYTWLHSKGLQRKATLDGLVRNTGAKEQKLVLGARTSFSIKTQVTVVTIPLNALGVV